MSGKKKGPSDRKGSLTIISAAAGMALAVGLPAGAWAQGAGAGEATQSGTQDTAQAQGGDNGAAAAGALQEVVVTAERRTENIQTTPISMQAVSGNTLESQNQTRIVDLQLTTPSFTSANINGEYAAPNIRGIGNNQFNATNTPGVTVTKDGLYLEGIHDLGDPFYDVQDVEVLRGPQGDFSNFASDGGAVQITTMNPNFKDGVTGYGEFQLGNYSDYRLDGAFNDALTDTFAVRLAFNWEQMHSFYRDEGAIIPVGAVGGAGVYPIQDPGHTDNKNFRFGALWKPNDNFNALLKIEYNFEDNGGTATEPNQTPYVLPAAALANGCPNALAPGGTLPPGPGGTCYSLYYGYSTHVPFQINYIEPYGRLPALDVPLVSWRDSLVLTGTLPSGIQLKWESGLQVTQWDTVNNNSCSCSDAATGATYQYIPNDNYYSQEFDVLSPSAGKLQWMTGAIWFARWSSTTIDAITSTPPYTLALPQYLVENTLTVARTEGVFGHLSYQFTPQWQVEVGARENWDNGYGRGPLAQVEIPNLKTPCTEKAPVQPGYGCINLATVGAFKDTAPTAKATVNWTPTQNQFIYAFFARGYKPGGFLVGNPQPFQNEYVNDWEIGWKTTALGGHLTNSLGGYYMVYQGMQQTITNVTSGVSTTANLATSTLEGIEESFNLREGGLGVQVDGDYEKSKLGALTQPASYALPSVASNKGQCTGPGGTVAGPGQATCFNYQPYMQTLSGEQQPFAPEYSATVTLDYRFPVFGGTLDPKIQWNYTAKQYGAIFEIPYYEMGARHIWNAYLTWDKGPWDTELFITNAFNQLYINGNFGGGNIFYGNPMQLGVRFRRDF